MKQGNKLQSVLVNLGMGGRGVGYKLRPTRYVYQKTEYDTDVPLGHTCLLTDGLIIQPNLT